MMDKLIQRTRMAERQVARRTKKLEALKWASQTKWDRIKRRQLIRREVGEHMRLAIKARHEDWEMGPLAPRRDSSVADKNSLYWGTVSSARVRPDIEMTKQERQARCVWAGGLQYLCLAVGDRVVVTEGAFVHQIGEIEEIKLDSATVLLKSHFMTNITMPSYLMSDEVGPIMPFNTAIPISAVRLVHPIHDPATGTTKDVIIQELRPVNISHDRVARRASWQRIVPGQNVKIPWPRQAPAKKEDHASDTLRIDVEEKTFVPTLLRPPMPESVIGELRNQYSRFRTRHTDEYIAQKEAEELEKKTRAMSTKTMLTPVQEFNRLEREKRKARGQPVLTDEMLEKIGEIITKNKDRIPAQNWAALWETAHQHRTTSETEKGSADVAELETALQQLQLELETPEKPVGQTPPS